MNCNRPWASATNSPAEEALLIDALRLTGDAARVCVTRALTIFERSLGPDHPNTAASLNNRPAEALDLDALVTSWSELVRLADRPETGQGRGRFPHQQRW